MMPHPTCTKETRTNNDNILRKQQEIKYSHQYMQKYNQELERKNNFNQNNDVQGWANNMDNISNSFYEYNLIKQNNINNSNYQNNNHFRQNLQNQQIKNNNINNNNNQSFMYNNGQNIINSRQPIGGMNEYSRFNEDTYLRSSSTSSQIPLDYNHENYQKDKFSNHIPNQAPQNTRNIGRMKVDEKPIQQCFQQDYFMSNFETLNQLNKGIPMFDNNEFSNHFMERNPTSTRRDEEEKIRSKDNGMFKTYQGGPMNSFVDLNPQYTRKERNNINSSSYVPMARTLAVPREQV